MTKNSLAKEKDILQALRGRPFFSKHLTIKVRQNKTNKNYRYTVIVSKKVMKLAVTRNKFKRRVRSVVGSQEKRIKKYVDFVIIAKKGAELAEFSNIKEETLAGLKKLNII